MNKDDVHHASHIKSDAERVSLADIAKDPLSLQNDNTSDCPSDVEKGLPWKDYYAQYQLHDLGGNLTVAVRHRKRFHISELARLESQEVLAKLRRLRHPNVLEFIHAYKTHTSLHAVFEPTAINFLHLVKCPVYLDEAQLGAVVGQVSIGARLLKTKLTYVRIQLVDGLSYLEGQGFEHPSLDSKNVLVTDAGVVKIGE